MIGRFKSACARTFLFSAEQIAGLALRPFLSRQKPVAELTRIGFIEINRLGDLELTLPALERLRAIFPKARIVLIASSALLDLLRSHPAIDEFVELDAPWMEHKGKYNPLRYRLFWKQVRRLRKLRLDACLDTRGDIRRHLVMALARIPERVSYDRFIGGEKKGYRGRLLTHVVAYPQKPLHRVEENVYLVEQWAKDRGTPLPATPVRPRPPRTLPVDRPVRVALHIESHWPNKVWDEGRWLSVMQELQRRYKVVFSLLTASRAFAENFTARSRVLNLTVETICVPLSQLRSRLEAVDVYLGVDSGPMHVADTEGCRVVAIFGPSDIRLWHPYNNGLAGVVHRQETCPYAPCRKPWCKTGDTRCMAEVSVAQVVDACAAIFSNSKFLQHEAANG